MSLLEVSALHSGYGRVNILHDVAVTVESGETVVLFGRNGAGKTTLVKTIAGHLAVTSGMVRVAGSSIENMSAAAIARVGVGYVPQERNIFGEMTVRENLEVSALSQGRRAPERIANAVARFPILGERSNQRASTLSGGERQILAITSALLADPHLLLLDEPTSGLAPSFVDMIVAWIEDLVSNRGTGVMWVVEQNPAPVLAISSRTYILEGGQIRAELDSSSLLEPGRLEAAILEEGSVVKEDPATPIE